MSRGIEGHSIFRDTIDREHFLSLLSAEIKRSGYKCYAWVLMKNHYHLLVRANENQLYCLMRPLNSKYARWFRKKYKSRGYLFQDRFKSLATQDQEYIEELVRYIHLNPLRAGICKTFAELDRFPWSGHAVLIRRRRCAFQDVRAVLRRFSHDPKIAIQKYRAYLQDRAGGTDAGNFLDIVRKSNKEVSDRKDHRCWVIGDPVFVKAALEQDAVKRLQLAACVKNGWTMKRVVEEVSQQMGIAAAEVIKRGRDNDRSMFRKVSAVLAHRSCGIPIIEIARYYGIRSSSVSRMLEDGERHARQHTISIKH
jgi:REP element-mobilizing transposase RayT